MVTEAKEKRLGIHAKSDFCAALEMAERGSSRTSLGVFNKHYTITHSCVIKSAPRVSSLN